MTDPKETFGRTWRAACALAGHFVLCLLSVLAIWAFEQILHKLYGVTEPMIFNHWPLKWLFDAIDIALILTFGVCGVLEAWSILRGKKHG